MKNMKHSPLKYPVSYVHHRTVIKFFVSISGTKSDYRTENILPISLSDINVASSIIGLTLKLKDSAVVSAIPLPKISTRINVLGSPVSECDGASSEPGFEDSNVVMTADEATELPPVIPIPAEDLVCVCALFFIN
jgi:hypothetical protein